MADPAMTWEGFLSSVGYRPEGGGNGLYTPVNPYSENGQAANYNEATLRDMFYGSIGQTNPTSAFGSQGRPDSFNELVDVGGQSMRRVGESNIYGKQSIYNSEYGYLFPEQQYQGLVAQNTKGDWSESLGNMLPVILAAIVTGGGAAAAAGAAGASSTTAAAVGGAAGGAVKGGFSGDEWSLSGAAKGAALGAASGAAFDYLGSAIQSPVPTGGGDNVTVGTASPFAGGATTDVVGREIVDGGASGYSFNPMTGDTVGSGGTPSSSLSVGGGTGGGTGTSAFGLQDLLNYAKAAQPYFSIASGLYGMSRANQTQQQSAALGARADPFGTSGGRAVADAQLQGLLLDPMEYAKKDKSYQLRLQAAARRNAPMGVDSGAFAIGAADASSSWYNDRLTQLGNLAGAGFNPASGAQIAQQGITNANDLLSKSLGSVAYGVNDLTGGNANGGMSSSILALLQQILNGQKK